MLQEELKDTKWIIRIRKSKDREHNGKNRTNNDLQNAKHRRLKMEQTNV